MPFQNTTPGAPGTLPQPCPSAGVRRPLPVEPCGVRNPRVPAAPGMDHRPCAHGRPLLCCSASRNGGPELRKALCHGPGSLLGPDSRRLPSRELPTSGAGAWLCSPACSARRISVTAPDAVDVASPASPAPTWLCHRAGFSGRSRTRVASPGRGAVGGLLGGQVFPWAPGFHVYIVVSVQPATRVCGLVNKTFRVLRKSLERAELARSSVTLLFKSFVCLSHCGPGSWLRCPASVVVAFLAGHRLLQQDPGRACVWRPSTHCVHSPRVVRTIRWCETRLRLGGGTPPGVLVLDCG